MTALSERPATTYTTRPRFEGANINVWIGFKHVMYLMEEGVLQHFRENDLAPQRLYEAYGLCFEIVASQIRIRHALYMDDLASVEVQPVATDDPQEAIYNVQIFVERDGKTMKAANGRVYVIFRRQPQFPALQSPPAFLAPFIRNEIRRPNDQPARAAGFTTAREAGEIDKAIIDQLTAHHNDAFVWKWHVPYFYCHFSKRLQHSGYLRLMEEVVDLFLADRGISIRTMLDTRQWIPVVPSAQVELLREALMEETLYTVYTVEEIFKTLTYRARMDCYVLRNDELIHTAEGHITHGYAKILDTSGWELVPFDETTLAALGSK